MSWLFTQLLIQDQRKHPLAFVRGIHWWPMNSPHKGQVTRNFFSIWWRHHVENDGEIYCQIVEMSLVHIWYLKFLRHFIQCSIQAMESQGSLNIKMPSYDVEIAIEKTVLSLQWKSLYRKRLSLYVEPRKETGPGWDVLIINIMFFTWMNYSKFLSCLKSLRTQLKYWLRWYFGRESFAPRRT